MTYRILFACLVLQYLAAPAHAARIVNMDDAPCSFKVQSGGETKTITLQPKQSYFAGAGNATVTMEDGKKLELTRYQKSVIHEGEPLLWRGKKTPGNDRPEGVR